MTPRRGNTILFLSSQQLPRLRLGPSKGPRLASCVASGTTEIQGHRQQQLTQTFIVRLLKTHLFTLILDCKKSTE